MAMYAYLMGLVKELKSSKYEAQRQVVKYVHDKCAKVGIVLDDLRALVLARKPAIKKISLQPYVTK